MKSFLLKHSGLQFLAIILLLCLTYATTTADITAEPVAESSAETADVTAEPAVEPPAELETEPPAEPPMEAEEEDGESPLKERMQKRISIEFRSTPIEDALMLMADQANVDIVKSPLVTGTVTVKLTDVPLGEALDNILTAHGYGFAADKNMIRVAPADEITQVSERIVSRIYRITYADVKEVEAALRKFISQQGSLSSNPGTSNIIVTDTESQVKAMDKFIEEIDRMTPQILVEVRIYDVTTDEDYDLGIEWNAGHNNTENSAVTVPDSTSFGVGMDNSPGLGTGSNVAARGTTTRTSKPFIAGSYDEFTGGSIRLGLLNDIMDIDIALNILHEQDYAKLLANPRIMVLDNEIATFEIIREIPYTEQTSTASTTTQTVKFKEVGVKLEVVPHVTRDGMVRLNIKPEFGVRVGTGTTGAPTVDTRKLSSIALVQDQQTVVVGGLRKDETTQDHWKVPIVGDVPLLGKLFQSQTESIQISELIVFITPKIITEPTLSPQEKEQFKDTEVQTPKKPDLVLDELEF